MSDMVVKDGRAFMRDQQGRAFSVPESEVARELAAGSRVEAPDEYEARQVARERGTIGQQALTVAEGAAEGATLGLSTAAATGLLGEDYRQAASERAAENPLARGAGVVGGALVPGLLSGGSGTAGAVARLTPAGALARGSTALERAVGSGLARAGVGGQGAGLLSTVANRAASMGAAGAAEGAAFGLGTSLAEDSLGGTEWTAERALAGMSDGALYGLGAGALIGGGTAAVTRAGRAAVEKMLGEGRTLRGALEDFADKRTIRGVVGDDAEAFRKITRNGEQMDRIPQLADKLRARGVASADDVPKAVQREIDDAGAVAKGIEDGADAAGARPSIRALLDEVDEQTRRLRDVGTPDHAQMARMIEKKVAQLRKAAAPPRDLQEVADVGLENLNFNRNHMRPESFTRVRAEYASGQPMRPVEITIFPKGAGAGGDIVLQDGRHRLAVAKELGINEIPARVSRMDLDGNIISETLGTLPIAAGGKVTGEAATSFGELRRFKTGLGEITNFARAHRNVAQGELSKLYGTVARTLEDTAESLGPEAGTAYREAMRDMDDFITIRGAMKREAARSAKKKLLQSGDAQAGIAGALGSLVLGSGGPMAALAGLALSASHKLIRERGGQALGKLADYALKTESGMRETARKLAGLSFDRSVLRATVAAPRSREKKREDFEGIRETVLAMQQNPAAITSRVEAAIAPFAAEQPEVAFAMAERISGDLAWISSKLPVPMSRAENSLTPLAEKPRLPARDEIRVANYAEALAKPQSVFASIAEGHVNWDGIEALKERRPQLWEGMREHVMRATAEAGKALPYRRRVLLGLAFDFKSDWSMANIAEIQKVGAQPADTGNGKPAMGNLDTSDNALPGQPGAESDAA